MRIIAGVHRGRRLQGPTGQAIRPTSDRVKEALFSILGQRTPDARVLDLYAGTGAIGIEALSRGATHVTFVEQDRQALRLLEANLRTCGMESHAQVCTCRVEQFFRRGTQWAGPYDIVFCDPPYDLVPDLIELMNAWEAGWFTEQAVVVLEHARKTMLPQMIGPLTQGKRYDYGDTALTLFHVGRQEPRPS
ncbi:MAG: 16S rRNA (guanine(966)-N(2))-methyltransferase RsmD [Nitrospiraceae bacterium]|nr:16S rRNA (guanine(966)-N(2))-methyltransferase RsmD [Nitrospiraceae bacterium]